jgi:peroxiredoxin
MNRIKNAALLVGGLALSASIGWNVRMFRENRRLQPAAPGLSAGASVAPFSAKNIADGRVETVSFDAARPTALYVFTPACPWCARNADNIRALASQSGEKYRFLGLSLSDTEPSRIQLPFPVYAGLGAETRKAYKLGPIPQMILIAPDGRVLKTWTGAFTGAVESEIERYFDIQLPGMGETPAS